MRYKALKESLSEKQIEQIINVFYPNRQWLRIYRKYSDHLKDSDDAREFAIYLIDNISFQYSLVILFCIVVELDLRTRYLDYHTQL